MSIEDSIRILPRGSVVVIQTDPETGRVRIQVTSPPPPQPPTPAIQVDIEEDSIERSSAVLSTKILSQIGLRS